jgi:hypothetical protein
VTQDTNAESGGPNFRDRQAGLYMGLAIGGGIGYLVGAYGIPYAEGFWGGLVVASAIAGWVMT